MQTEICPPRQTPDFCNCALVETTPDMTNSTMTSALATYPAQYINCHWVKARSSETLPVYDSRTEALVATGPSGMVPEAETAVLAASAALTDAPR